MGIPHKLILRLLRSPRCTIVVATACAFLLIAEQASASGGEPFGIVEVEKTGPGAATSTVTSEPSGINCGTECAFGFGIVGRIKVTLIATPGASYVLAGWTLTPESATCPNGSLAATCEVLTEAFTPTKVEANFVAAPPPPVSTTGGTSDVGPHAAIVEGAVNPEGSVVSECYIEYGRSTGYGLTAPCAPADPGSGISTVRVTASLTGLAAETAYHYRLVAVGLGGTVRGEDRSFTTEPAPPAVSAQTPEYTQTLAHLRDLINPERSLTTYYFRFGTTTSYGQTVPVSAASAGSGEAPVSISQLVTGLTPGVTYHYRLVATNAQGTVTGPDQTFTPLAPLHDNRAYEMVTPPFKSFDNIVLEHAGLAVASTQAISSGGSSLLEDSVPFLGTGSVPADEQLLGTYYALERGPSGWTTSSLTPAASVFAISHEELANPANLGEGLWSAATPSQSVYAEDFYLREADGAFANIGPIAPPSATEGPPHGANPGTERLKHANDAIVGASSSLSDVVFQMTPPAVEEEEAGTILWPGDGTVTGNNQPSLYEYVGHGHSGEGQDVPALVGVDNVGDQISQCGTGLGDELANEAHVVPDGVSAAGSSVFFTAAAGGCTGANRTGNEIVGTGPVSTQLYARIGPPGQDQTTVNVAGSTECATSVSCNLTSPVKFVGVAKDGSKVFFTTEQALLPGDQDTTNDIYECELPGDNGATPTPVGIVDACPDLKAVSVTGTNSGANVQSVVAVSEEGSRVYFTATGVLTSEPDLSLSSGHQVATEGEDNLYVWEAPSAEHPTGNVAFVATLPEPSPTHAQATPDGRYLVFTTTADLTPDDRSTVAQVFRYDGQTGELVRVSVGQEGFNNDGNTYADPATLAGQQFETEGRLTVSANGSIVVFQSSDALTPQVQGGLKNVYEWHDGNVYLISDGVDQNGQAGLLGMDASGTNIFFTTSERLVAQDTDEEVDIYDAHVGGGFPEPTPTPSCSGEACQGSLSTPLAASPVGSTSAPAIGNLSPPASKPAPSTPRPKPLTGAQKLKKALKLCRKQRSRTKRKKCAMQAKKQYRAVVKKGGPKR